MQFREFICARCKNPTRRPRQALHDICVSCKDAHRLEGGRASALVAKEIRNGTLTPANNFNCTDCGNKASQYDHRDYSKPLQIDPVCKSCNWHRGLAMDSQLRLPLPKIIDREHKKLHK